mmetsp:Transcript_9752/g.14972  ORF Transcript_9752/g.14972 Transcript_9752/m.14972 type:complete len:85 (-) Transcript_9752:133-387(-)
MSGSLSSEISKSVLGASSLADELNGSADDDDDDDDDLLGDSVATVDDSPTGSNSTSRTSLGLAKTLVLPKDDDDLGDTQPMGER